MPDGDSQSAFGNIVSFGLFLPKLKAKGQQIGIGPVVALFIEPIYQPVDNGLAMEWAVKLNLTPLIPE